MTKQIHPYVRESEQERKELCRKISGHRAPHCTHNWWKAFWKGYYKEHYNDETKSYS